MSTHTLEELDFALDKLEKMARAFHLAQESESVSSNRTGSEQVVT
jgi:hypothetical protein